MRLILIAIALLAVPAASAGPGAPVTGSYDATLPSDDCPDCVGASVAAGTTNPPNCADCTTLGAGAGVERDEDGTEASAKLCRGGFIYICPVDETVRL